MFSEHKESRIQRKQSIQQEPVKQHKGKHSGLDRWALPNLIIWFNLLIDFTCGLIYFVFSQASQVSKCVDSNGGHCRKEFFPFHPWNVPIGKKGVPRVTAEQLDQIHQASMSRVLLDALQTAANQAVAISNTAKAATMEAFVRLTQAQGQAALLMKSIIHGMCQDAFCSMSCTERELLILRSKALAERSLSVVAYYKCLEDQNKNPREGTPEFAEWNMASFIKDQFLKFIQDMDKVIFEDIRTKLHSCEQEFERVPKDWKQWVLKSPEDRRDVTYRTTWALVGPAWAWAAWAWA